MSISSKIRTLRERHNYTQAYVAQKLGISPKWYGQLEIEDNLVKDKYLDILAQLYNVSVEDIKNFDERVVINQTFNNSAENNNGNNIVNPSTELLSKLEKANYEIVKAKDELIANLKEMIMFLKKKNDG